MVTGYFLPQDYFTGRLKPQQGLSVCVCPGGNNAVLMFSHAASPRCSEVLQAAFIFPESLTTRPRARSRLSLYFFSMTEEISVILHEILL